MEWCYLTAQKRDENEINQGKIIDQLRCLGIDMISEANSGHPGTIYFVCASFKIWSYWSELF